jgi:hypothetical protein
VSPTVAVTAFAVALLAGCDGTRTPLSPDTAAPFIRDVTVGPNLHNVLSAVVSARIMNADSVAVRFGKEGSALNTSTPAYAVLHGDIDIPLLGLQADTEYHLRLVAHGVAAVGESETFTFVTSPLPHDLPQYHTTGGPHVGFTLFAAGSYILAIDHSGQVVWYRRFEPGAGLNVQAQPNGRYTVRPPPPAPGQLAPWLELDALGNVTRTLHCARGLPNRFHDLLVSRDGSYWILCDETRMMNLSAIGGLPSAYVTGTVVQHIGGDGTLRFEWSAFDHFELTDLPWTERQGPLVNWTHGNALDIDAAGNLLLSSRSLSEVTKIDGSTGAVLWRMGGLRNQFTFENTPAIPFARQHGVRAVRADELLLLDNLGDPMQSRAERYRVDEAALTVRQIATYGSDPPVIAELGGTVQQLENTVLVSFGSGGRVEEYDAAGTVVWRLEQPGYVFRAQRITSLHAPGMPARP